MPRTLPLKSLDETSFQKIADRFKALGEATRLRILEALMRGEMNVSEIVACTGAQQSNVSRHLKILQSANLIGKRKEGTNVIYRVIDASLSDICMLICRGANVR